MRAKKKIDVRRVHSSLVANFSTAEPPLTWRLDLDRHDNFSLELRKYGETTTLGMLKAGTDFQPVASFPSRDDAEEALARVSKVMATGRFAWIKRVFIGIALFLILITAFMLLLTVINSRPHIAQTTLPNPAMVHSPSSPAAPSGTPTAETTPPPDPKIGVPLPADEVLKAPSE